MTLFCPKRVAEVSKINEIQKKVPGGNLLCGCYSVAALRQAVCPGFVWGGGLV